MKWILPTVLSLAVLACLVLAAYPFWPDVIPNRSDASGYGSWMSGIGAVALQAVVIFLLYITYRSQQEELSKTTLAMHAQNESMRRQRVDATFFELLSRYDAAVAATYHYSALDGKSTGRRAFEFLLGTITIEIDKADGSLSNWHAIRGVVQARRREYSEWIRSINTICSFLNRDAGNDVGYYMTIFRGYLSDFEMLFLMIELASREDGSFTAHFLNKHGIFRYAPQPAPTREYWWRMIAERLRVHDRGQSI